MARFDATPIPHHVHLDSAMAEQQTAAFDAAYRLDFVLTESQREAAYALRYQVYCEEFTCYEPKGRFPDHLERNPSDDHSIHMLVTRRSDGVPVATSRLVRTNPATPTDLLPFEEACSDTLYPWAVPEDASSRQAIAELSRYAILKECRRHHADSLSDIENQALPMLPIAMALFCEAVARHAGIQSIYAVMEDWLAEGSRAIGMHLIPIGTPTAFHGQRTPYSVDFSACPQMFPTLYQAACMAAQHAVPRLLNGVPIRSVPATRPC